MNEERYDLEKIEFKAEKRFLSNMYPARMVIDYVIYDSVEHYYQSEKFSGGNARSQIIKANSPEKAKTLSRKIEKKHPEWVREDWDKSKKVKTMRTGVFEKFAQNKDIGKKLLLVEGYIEERNCWGDTFWGTVDGEGENKLGKILMTTQAKLKDMFGMPRQSNEKIISIMDGNEKDPEERSRPHA